MLLASASSSRSPARSESKTTSAGKPASIDDSKTGTPGFVADIHWRTSVRRSSPTKSILLRIMASPAPSCRRTRPPTYLSCRAVHDRLCVGNHNRALDAQRRMASRQARYGARIRDAARLDDDSLGNGVASDEFLSASIRSPPIVQHMQPLVSSMACAPVDAIVSPSTLTLPKSLTSTAKRIPFALRSKAFSSVVFPAPRYPPITVTGIGFTATSTSRL